MNADQKKLESIFNALANSFAEADRAVKEYEESLVQSVQKFTAATARPATLILKDEMPITKVFVDIHETFAKDCENWAMEIEQTGKNFSFREKLNDSMLVYVYGKVKSGKSSLGNFVAYGMHDPSAEYIDQCPRVDFDVEAVQNNEDAVEQKKIAKQRESTQIERRFLVDFLEATACIQYFRKPGLTWIDSPGIHSMTSANGELAKRYLGSADLVVYTTTGRSAMQEADRKELVEIIKSKKPFVVVITRCDEYDEDIDESGNIVKTLKMFSDDERDEVVEWSVSSLINSLRERDITIDKADLKKDTLTISCKYAEEHANDKNWGHSGLLDFLNKLADIAQNDGVRIKRNTPLKEILNHIEKIIRESDEQLNKIENGSIQLDSLNKKIHRKSENKMYKCTTKIKSEVMKLAHELYGRDNEFKNKAASITNSIITEAVNELAEEIVQDTETMTKNMPINVQITDLQAFADITQTVTYQATENRRNGSLLGAVVGGVAGFFLGGAAGAVAGASLGATAGNAVGAATDDDNVITTRVGDNRSEVGREAAEMLEKETQQVFNGICSKFEKECIHPLRTWLDNLDNHIAELKRFLDNAKTKIEGEMINE